jgi:hypothetical protein
VEVPRARYLELLADAVRAGRAGVEDAEGAKDAEAQRR